MFKSSSQTRLIAAAACAAAITCGAFSSSATAAPNVSAPAAILVEPGTGDIVFERNASQQRPIASTTKMMTALVTIENSKLDRVVTTVPYNGLAVESTGGFKGGEKVTVRTLVQALLIASANDAANTLAVRIGGSKEKFVAMMNARAKKAGLNHTHFANAVGLDAPGNYSSATDLAKIALLLRQSAFIRKTTNMKSVKVNSGGRPRTLKNRDLLIGREPFMNGMKTGHTQGAGWVLVGSGTRKGVTLISAVLGTGGEAARNNDTLALMKYGFKRYHVVTAVTANQVYTKVKLKDRTETVDLIASEGLKRTVRNGHSVKLSPAVPTELNGPLAAGAKVGTLNVVYDGRTVNRIPLVTTAAVIAAAVPAESSGSPVVPILIVMGVLALCTLLLFLWRRRAARRRQRVASAESEPWTA